MSEKPTGIEKAAGLGLVVSLAGVVAAVVRSKTAALLIGPDGVGLVAEVQQLATLSFVPLGAFAGAALVQGLAKQRGDARVTGAALGWSLLVGSVLAMVMLVTAPFLLPVEWSTTLRSATALAAVASLTTALSAIALQVLLFHGRIATVTKQQLLTTGIGAVLAVGLTWWLGVTGQFLTLALTPLIMLLPAIMAARATGSWPTRAQTSLDRGFLRNALLVGIASLITATAVQGALYSTRWQLERAGGLSWNGQFQAAWSIGALYLNMVLSGLGNFAFPRYATAPDTAALQIEVDSSARFIARFAPPLVLLATVFAGLGVHLLYSSRFDDAVGVLRWQLAGDVAKCFAWAYAGPLLYRGHVRAFLLTESLAALLLGGLPWLLVPQFGIAGTGMAYLATYIVYLPLTVFVARRTLGISARPSHLVIAMGSTAVFIALALLPPSRVLQAVAATASIVWLWRVNAFQLVLGRLRKRGVA